MGDGNLKALLNAIFLNGFKKVKFMPVKIYEDKLNKEMCCQ